MKEGVKKLDAKVLKWLIEAPEVGSLYYCDKCNSWYISTDIKTLDYSDLDNWNKPACPKCGFWQPDNCIKFGLCCIDENIAPLIKWLNDKGYKTVACCSGHVLDKRYESHYSKHKNKYFIGHPYIYFEDNSNLNKKTKDFEEWVSKNRNKLMSIYGVYIDENTCIFRELYKVDSNYKDIDSMDLDVHIVRLKSLISFIESVKNIILFYEEVVCKNY